MPEDIVRYPCYRYPAAIISHAVWLYYRFTLSFRDVEDLLAQRGITVSYETVRHWCETFGLAYDCARTARPAKRQRLLPEAARWALAVLLLRGLTARNGRPNFRIVRGGPAQPQT